MLPATTTIKSVQTYIETVLGITAARQQNSQLLKSLLASQSLQVSFCFVNLSLHYRVIKLSQTVLFH
jgi:hypothetical protein